MHKMAANGNNYNNGLVGKRKTLPVPAPGAASSLTSSAAVMSRHIESLSGQNARFTYAVSNCQGWRPSQEDAHLALADMERNTSIFGVFDGHNGPEVAQFVATYLPKQLLRNHSYRNGQVERGLQESFMALDELLLTDEANQLMVDHRKRIGFRPLLPPGHETAPVSQFTGCTAVVLLVKNDIYYCANVGDSRCLVSRDGRPHQLSRDHKPDLPEERARIEKAGGVIINGRINGSIDVSRAFGDHWYKQNGSLNPKQQMVTAWPYTAVEKMSIRDDEFFTLICDGIWNAITNKELVQFIRSRLPEQPMDYRKRTLQHICQDLIRKILPNEQPKHTKAGNDNMTIMIVKSLTPDQQQRCGDDLPSLVNINAAARAAPDLHQQPPPPPPRSSIRRAGSSRAIGGSSPLTSGSRMQSSLAERIKRNSINHQRQQQHRTTGSGCSFSKSKTRLNN